MEYLAVAGEYIAWWYSGGLKRLFAWLAAVFGSISNFFSIGRVLKTLFSPWKRLVGARRPGLDGFKDWLVDNFVSRLVGFVVRVVVIFGYLASMLLMAIFAGVAVLFWVLWPAILIYSLIRMFA